jgi:hypothetical protein
VIYNLIMLYRKVKIFCFIVDFFICIVIKNYCCDIKNVKKLECFLFNFLKKSEKKIE